jgi:hypothetical protein
MIDFDLFTRPLWSARGRRVINIGLRTSRIKTRDNVVTVLINDNESRARLEVVKSAEIYNHREKAELELEPVNR